MPSTTSCKFGAVVPVSFPFTNHEGSKKRPAVVISSADYSLQRPDVIVLAITSRVRQSSGFGECLIEEWEQAGLLKSSAFKPLIATVEQAIVQRTLGQLAAGDLARLHALLWEVPGEKSMAAK